MLPDGVVDPALNAARVETIVVIVAATVASAIAHVGDEQGVAVPARLEFTKMPPPESPEQT